MENKCEVSADNFIKNLIYKEKVVVFGLNDCEYTKKANEFFKENFNYLSRLVLIDQLKEDVKLVDNIKDCLVKRTNNNVIPKIYINGMYLGNYNNIRDKHFRKDLDIFF
jgi:glutaredoxin-related protein